MDTTAEIRPPRRGPKLPGLVLTDEERAALERWARRRTSSQALAERCRIVLACAAGASNREVAQDLGVARSTVIKWRSRFVARRLEAWWTSHGPEPPASSPTNTSNGSSSPPWRSRPPTPPIGRPGPWPGCWAEPDRGQPDLAGVRAQAAADRGVQALHRPAGHRQGPRHRRAVPQPAPGGSGPVCR